LTRRRPRKRRWRRLLILLLVASAAAAGARVWLEVRARNRTARIASLERARDELQARLAALSAKDPVVASAPDDDVLVGVPARVATDLLGRITTRLVHQVEVVLGNLHVRKAGDVHTKGLVKSPGRYRVDLRIHQVSGVLELGAPKLDFQGDRIAIVLPVRLVRGEGRATLRFAWKSRGIAGLACGDFRARIPVSGRVVPRTYHASGNFTLELVDRTVVATPTFPDLKVNFHVEPSPETWKEVDRVIAQRSLQCRAALKLVDVRQLLRRLLDRGFNVKVPPDVVKPFRLPASLRREVSLGERTTVVRMVPRRLSLAPQVVWLGAQVESEPAAAASPAPAPAPAGGKP
jgi:hypothetical protein